MEIPVSMSLDWAQRLEERGWAVAQSELLKPMPESVIQRYHWVPRETIQLLETFQEICAPDEKTWLLTSTHYRGESDSAFAWNEWEQLSLEAAGDDPAWRQEVITFWDDHFPFMTSLKSGYAYFALERSALRVVAGEEPEFEDVSPVANRLSEFLEQVARGSAELDRWL